MAIKVATINQGSSTVDDEAKVTAITGGKVNGLTVSLEVSPDTKNVDLSGMISVSKNSSWQLYADIARQILIPTKYATNLIDGNNTYYIVVNSSDEKINRTYTLNIWKNYYATVFYYINDELVDTQENVPSHTYLNDRIPQKTGYSVVEGWNCKNYYVDSKVITFNAKMNPNTYKVTFEANGGKCSETSKKVTYDKEYSLPIPTREDYFFCGWQYNNNLITDEKGTGIDIWKNNSDVKLTTLWERETEHFCIIKSNKITGLTSKDITKLKIPDYITSIGDEAFKGCKNLANVTIGDSVTSIGTSAFRNCSSLTSINWNAVSIATLASTYHPFENCTNITTVNIGKNVQSIPEYAFYNFSRLTSIDIPNSVTSIGEVRSMVAVV